MAGRPKHWFTIDLDNIDDTVREALKKNCIFSELFQISSDPPTP